MAALITAVNLNFSDQWLATDNAVENEDSRDWLWEVCCVNDSTRTRAALDRGHRARRLNITTKYDASKRKCVEEAKRQVKENRPRRIWFSLLWHLLVQLRRLELQHA